MRNAEIALHFDELGDLYELDGAVSYRVQAYRTAAQAIRNSPVSVEELAKEGRATELPGVGKTLAEKLDALIESGSIPAAEKLKAQFPPGLSEIPWPPGLGPKKARRLFDELGIDSLDKLKEAAENERIRKLRGFGQRAEENILHALAAGDPPGGGRQPRILLSKVLEVSNALIAALREHPAAERVELAGSARRWTDTCKDVDIVATASDARSLADAFCSMPMIAEATSPGEAGAHGVTHNGLKIDLRIVEPQNFGNLLQHLTGSKAHNEALRTDAVKRGFHVSEYGVIDDSTGTTHACATEHEVYELLGMQYIPPELRENRVELKAARAGELPELIADGDIRGDLHCHTVASDGRNTIEQMALAARDRGYEYIAITDHSATHGFGNHVTPDDLRRQIEKVREVDERVEGIRVLIGTETNI